MTMMTNVTTTNVTMINNKKKCRFISPSLMLILVILISTSIESCFANVSGGREGGGICMGLSRNNNKKGDKYDNKRNSINPVALGLRRAFSRPGILQHTKSKSKSIATVASTTKASSNNNDKLREREFYDHGVDEEARATGFAFIDHSEEASEIALTMKPHLKHISSSSESLSSSLEQASSSVIKRRSQSITTNAKSTTQMAYASSSTNNENTTTPRGGSAATATATAMRPLYFWESMVSGAVSRSIAQTVMHPANTMKTMMQSSMGPSKLTLKDLIKPQMFRRLSVGAGANFVLSLPQ
jgi:hypothetical protein